MSVYSVVEFAILKDALLSAFRSFNGAFGRHDNADDSQIMLEKLLVPSTLDRNVDLWSGGSITKACKMRRLLPIITC